jgi:hypothetical protein
MISFSPATYVRELEATAREGGWTIRYLSPTPAGPRPWLERPALERAAVQPPPRLYLSAGIHGDEVAGPLAVLEMLRQPGFFAKVDATLFPILNPEGLARVTRGNYAGIDLNRDYRGTRSSEIRGHLAALRTLGRFDAAMMLHEDYEATGAYLFELNDSPVTDLGTRIIRALEKHVPIDRRPQIDDFIARDGIILRSDITQLMGPIENRPEWPEAIYLSIHHTQVCYTTETPMLQPLATRIAAQIAAVRTVIEALTSTP